MNRIQFGNWVPGAVLRTYSKRHNVWHFGIAAHLDASGPMVMHGSKDRGQFTLTPYSEFADGQAADYTWFPENLETQEAVLNRAESLLGKPFRLFDSNCEDYVNWIVTGVARSPQREQAVLGVLILLLLGGLGGILVKR